VALVVEMVVAMVLQELPILAAVAAAAVTMLQFLATGIPAAPASSSSNTKSLLPLQSSPLNQRRSGWRRLALSALTTSLLRVAAEAAMLLLLMGRQVLVGREASVLELH
jgi:hypothetical protein